MRTHLAIWRADLLGEPLGLVSEVDLVARVFNPDLLERERDAMGVLRALCKTSVGVRRYENTTGDAHPESVEDDLSGLGHRGVEMK